MTIMRAALPFAFLLAAQLGVSSSASAQSCDRVVDAELRSPDVTLVDTPDVPIGGYLGTGGNAPFGAVILCRTDRPYAFDLNIIGTSSTTLPDVFDTGIPGVGVRIHINRPDRVWVPLAPLKFNMHSSLGDERLSASSSPYTFKIGYVLSFIKTGKVTAGDYVSTRFAIGRVEASKFLKPTDVLASSDLVIPATRFVVTGIH